jgi:hypothetical protein
MQSNALTVERIEVEQTEEEIRSIFKKLKGNIKQQENLIESNVGWATGADRAFFTISSAGEEINIELASALVSDIESQKTVYSIQITVRGGMITTHTERVCEKIVQILSQYVNKHER